MVANKTNENMSLTDIIRENSWFICDKCEYKSKTKKSFKNHTLKTHSVGYQENSDVAVRESAGKRKCSICGYITNSSDINNHIKKEHEEYLKEGLLRISYFNNIFLILDVVYILVSFSWVSF